jgi:O-antigen/teichoic acid export membrane protein
VPLAVVLSATAVAIVPLLFGHAYEGAAVVLAILAWKIPMTAFGLPYGAVLVAREKQVALMQNNLVAGGLTVVADLAVIPLLGIRGAAVVGVGSAVLVSYLNQRSCVRRGFVPSLRLVLAAAPAR